MQGSTNRSRRDFIKASITASAGMWFLGQRAILGQTPTPPDGPFHLPPLPYAFNALEPHIDARTMEIHYTKHHQAYVNNLNLAVQGTPWAQQPIENILKHLADVPEQIRTVVQNHGGGHANHCLFWSIMGPGGGGRPSGTLAAAMDRDLGGWDAFQTAFTDSATKRFGSGWAWLSVTGEKRLVVESTANQDSPLSIGHVPILGIDVWEHAYYLLYQNRRPDYIAAFYHVIDWNAVQQRYEEALAA